MIDSHQHFWTYDTERHDWISDDFAAIRHDFLPEDLMPVLAENGISGCIAVQADQNMAENEFLLDLASKNNFIKGIVGWTDLQHDQLEKELEFFQYFPIIKGFRHILQAETQRDLFLQPRFKAGLALLNRYGYSYDILVHADQLQYLPALLREFPDLHFVLDHLGKPPISSGKIKEWERDIRAIAEFEQLSCKVSGFLTEADLKRWKSTDFHPYFDLLVELFGIDRLMYGSDWPVCLAAGSYGEAKDVVTDYFGAFSLDEQDAFFRRNASAFYKL